MRTSLTLGIEACYDPSWTGGFQYVRNVVTILASLPHEARPAVRVLPLNVASARRMLDLTSTDGIALAGDPGTVPTWRLGPRLLARRALRKYVQPRVGRTLEPAFRGIDVTYPNFGTPLPDAAQMHWIPDLQHRHLPELFSARELRERKRRVAGVATTRGVVVLSSRNALQDFRRLFPDSRVEPHVWSFCSNIRFDPAVSPEPNDVLPEFYVYTPNQFWKHKDHLTLFRAILGLRKRGVRIPLVCTGLMQDPRHPGYVTEVQAFLQETGLNDQILLLGLLQRDEQVAVLRRAAAVIQPSRFEGWSTVVEDTKAVGRPMVLSDIGVHREQAPEAHFFSQGDHEALADVIADVVDDWTPGPDATAERRAQEQVAHRRVESARKFAALARRAREIG